LAFKPVTALQTLSGCHLRRHRAFGRVEFWPNISMGYATHSRSWPYLVENGGA
jgi:hypothetical protein